MSTRTTAARPRPMSTAPRNGDSILLQVPEEEPWNNSGPHENRFVVAYWLTEPADDRGPRWQALAGGTAVKDLDGSSIGYKDDDVEGWFPLPGGRAVDR